MELGFKIFFGFLKSNYGCVNRIKSATGKGCRFLMAFTNVFKRFELKYLITKDQKERILERINPYIDDDEFGHTTIRNIYFDTDSYRLIRRSIEKPAYKEKIRVRSYSQATPESTVFAELKKKFKHVVYKRRLPLKEESAMKWIEGKIACPNDSQIAEEINYFIDYYGPLYPKVFLSYERDAYYAKEQPDFRITFDESILCRTYDLSLKSKVYGAPILDEDAALMELKCSGGIPMWMTGVLTDEKIYKTSFSKYGEAYKDIIFPRLMEAANA